MDAQTTGAADVADNGSSRSVNDTLSRALVAIFKDYTGRGPTKAKVLITPDLVVGLFSDTLMKAEISLVATEKAEAVRSMRRSFQDTMRDDMIAAVESAVGQRVVTFLSDNSLEPDVAVEVFMLEPKPG